MNIRFFSILAGLVLLVSNAAQAVDNDVRFGGDATWAISGPNCTFKVYNFIQNYNPDGDISGSLRLALILTRTPFPATGTRLCIYNLGQLEGNHYFPAFKGVAPVSLAGYSGYCYFTVVLEQYADGGVWVVSDYRTSLAKYMWNGAFVAAPKWIPPAKPIKAPVAKVKAGNLFTASIRADDGVRQAPPKEKYWYKLKIQAGGKVFLTTTINKKGATTRYTYTTPIVVYKGKKIRVGRLKINFGKRNGVSSYAIFDFYFQSTKSGFYKGSMTSDLGKTKDAGTFSLK